MAGGILNLLVCLCPLIFTLPGSKLPRRPQYCLSHDIDLNDGDRWFFREDLSFKGSHREEG